MKGLRFLDRRIGFSVGALGILLGSIVPAVMPTFASAAQITSRSIEMGSAEIGATTNYTVTFTPNATGAGYVVILFCDSGSGSFEGSSCTTPTSISTAGVSLDTAGGAGGATDTSNSIDGTATGNHIVVKTTLSAPDTIVLKNMVNPSTAHATFYARIETFITGQNGLTLDSDAETAAQNAATSATTTTGLADFGGVALTTTDDIGVNAAVEESMLFCVAGNNSSTPPAAGCTGSLADPSINLGTQEGSNYILPSAGTTETASDYAQMSTNARNGAVVYLKSNTAGCGGMWLNTDHTQCGIKPDTTYSSALTAGAGEFGLTVGSSSGESGGSAPSGSLDPVNHYNATDPFIDYVTGDSTGVTSAYGSQILAAHSSGTTLGPISNEYVPITFSANAAPTTPAGQYSATLNMIAVGTF